jgi:hypothetical protein
MEETIPQEEPAPWPKKPWFYIWIRPRKTIRAIVNSTPERFRFLIAVIYGISQYSDELKFYTTDENINPIFILPKKLFFGFL